MVLFVCSSFYMYCAWGLFSFLSLWIYSFHQVCKVSFYHYHFKCYFFPPAPAQGTNHLNTELFSIFINYFSLSAEGHSAFLQRDIYFRDLRSGLLPLSWTAMGDQCQGSSR